MAATNPYLQTCPTCKGEKEIQQAPAHKGAGVKITGISCPACNGIGKVLTAEGEWIKEAVEHINSGGR